jgi:hypothetical protein
MSSNHCALREGLRRDEYTVVVHTDPKGCDWVLVPIPSAYLLARMVKPAHAGGPSAEVESLLLVMVVLAIGLSPRHSPRPPSTPRDPVIEARAGKANGRSLPCHCR